MQLNRLLSPSHTVAEVQLSPGESIVVESGAMMAMSTSIAVTTPGSGLVRGLRRFFGGDGVGRNIFTAERDAGRVLLAPTLVGDLAVLPVGDRSWCVQGGAFVASDLSVELAPFGAAARGFFAGAAFFVLKATGVGDLLVSGFGAIEAIAVSGEMVFDTGHIVAWESTLTYEIERALPGWVDSLLSREGLVVRFTGVGVVYVQSRNAVEYARSAGEALPPRV